MRPRVAGAVSAGAAIAYMLFAGAVGDGVAYFKAGSLPAHATPTHSTCSSAGGSSATEIYRDTILTNLDAARLAPSTRG
jgi:hypothetical protein